jgi:DNA-binding NarL/FixJ family response regulator
LSRVLSAASRRRFPVKNNARSTKITVSADGRGLALGKTAHVAVAASDNASAGLLGKRQADVARLVADGLTNKQIGARLFISERTVDSHVRSILNKLGFNSRAQIAAWMASVNQ